MGQQYDTVGSISVYTRSGGVWTLQVSGLVGSGYVGTPRQGTDCKLSSDGNTLVVGGMTDATGIGAVWVFVTNATTWSQQGSKLVGTGYVGPSVFQGYSVSISSDGNTIAFGAYYDNNGIGAAWVFVRSGTTWSQQGSKLVGTEYVGWPRQGYSVSLHPSGNMLAIGAPDDDSAKGALWTFSRIADVWSQNGNKLVATIGSSSKLGYTVHLAHHMLVTGSPEDNNNIGAVWSFGREIDVVLENNSSSSTGV